MRLFVGGTEHREGLVSPEQSVVLQIWGRREGREGRGGEVRGGGESGEGQRGG